MKLVKGPTMPDSVRRPIRSVGYYVTRWRGQIVVRRNPRFRQNAATPLQQQQRDDMAYLAKQLANVSPGDRAYAQALADNTQLTWRDVMSLAMLGRWIVVPGDLPDMAYPDIDQIGTVPGSILVRESAGWLLLEPGDQGKVLTMLSGFPRWQDLPPTPTPPPGSGSGLFAGEIVPPPYLADSYFTLRNSPNAQDFTDGIELYDTGTSTWRGLEIAAPATPYRAAVLLTTPTPLFRTGGFANVYTGLGFNDGTKLQLLYYYENNDGNTKLTVDNWSNNSSFAANARGVAIGFNMPPQAQWLAVSDDGTNVSFEVSSNGENWHTFYQVAKASGYLGASGYTNIFAGLANFSSETTCPSSTSLLSWSI